jgi:hypothetical protein
MYVFSLPACAPTKREELCLCERLGFVVEQRNRQQEKKNQRFGEKELDFFVLINDNALGNLQSCELFFFRKGEPPASASK